MRQNSSSHHSIEELMPATSRIGGSAGSPKASVQRLTPFASIKRSVTSLLLSALRCSRVSFPSFRRDLHEAFVSGAPIESVLPIPQSRIQRVSQAVAEEV